MLDETRLAVINADLKMTGDKLDGVRAKINQADEAMRLFPLTFSSTGRCHDFVAQVFCIKIGLPYTSKEPILSDVKRDLLTRAYLRSEHDPCSISAKYITTHSSRVI